MNRNHQRIFAKKLRKNLTEAEQTLWHRLRRNQIHGCKFRRQCPIDQFIVDFVCFEKMLVVELDGGQHSETIETDQQRTNRLSKLGFRVIRFWNHEVLNQTDAVVENIGSLIQNTTTEP
ncbi:MAG: endonuclease domain-containing protein [Pseudomonadota bacterium]